MADNQTTPDMGSLRHQPSKVTRLRRALIPATAGFLGFAVVGSLAYQMINSSTPAPRPESKAAVGSGPVMDLPTDYVEQYQPHNRQPIPHRPLRRRRLSRMFHRPSTSASRRRPCHLRVHSSSGNP